MPGLILYRRGTIDVGGGRERVGTFDAAVDADNVDVKCAPLVNKGTGEAPVSVPQPCQAPVQYPGKVFSEQCV